MKLNKKNIFIWFCFAAFIFAIIFYKLSFDVNRLGEGYKAKMDVFTDKEFVDELATEAARDEAAERTKDVYRILPSVQLDIWDAISGYLNAARELKADDTLPMNEKVRALSAKTNIDLDENINIAILEMEFDQINSLSYSLDKVLNQILSRGITEEDIDYEKKALSHTLKSVFNDEKQYDVGFALLESLLVPNEFIDEEATEIEREKSRVRVPEVIIPAGSKIVSEGELIGPEEALLLEKAGLIGESSTLRYDKLILKLALALLLISCMYFYFEVYLGNVLSSVAHVLTIDAVTIAALIPLMTSSKYFHPLGFAAALVTILSGLKVSLINIPFLMLLSLEMFELPLSLGFAYTASAMLLSYLISRNKSRSLVIMYTLLYGAVIAIVLSVKDYSYMLSGDYSHFIPYALLLVNGFVVGIISLGTVPIWERLFKILTDYRLMELSDSNNALLHRLLLEAPGTYHHSMMVGTLGEACAEAIGANALICRIGGYYHDIGKLKNPMYFKENQGSLKNPHDDLSYEESAQIIINHAVYGVELGTENKLPKEVIDIINEHHGTSLVGYFYALAKNENADVEMEKFRYKGKKPQTAESLIIRVCDMCEAAVRSIKSPTEQSIDEMIDKIFKSNIESDQLTDAPVTLNQIYVIKDVMHAQIKSIYHGRIEYPKDALKLEEGK